MSCPDVSGIISNILFAVNDDDGITYPSGKVNQAIFKAVPNLNGLMGTCFSGSAGEGCISPSISGTVYQGILELYVAQQLVKRTMTSSASNFTMTSFKEGDSTVTLSDAAKNLTALYKVLSDEFDKMVTQTKFSISSRSPCAIYGADAFLQDSLPYQEYTVYRYRL